MDEQVGSNDMGAGSSPAWGTYSEVGELVDPPVFETGHFVGSKPTFRTLFFYAGECRPNRRLSRGQSNSGLVKASE